MGKEQEKYACALCGYTADGRFVGDICPECGLTYWKCSKCGFLITAGKPPEICPECSERDCFIDVTCYIPECGGPSHIDPRFSEKRLRDMNNRKLIGDLLRSGESRII